MRANGFPDALLVEDNSNDAEMTLRGLKRARIEADIHRVDDGAAALEYLFGPGLRERAERLRVVLLDIKMPKVDGLEVLKRMRSDPALRQVPVVIFTSSSEPGDLKEGLRLGANSYVVKPVDFDGYMDSVAQIGRYWLTLNRSTL